MAPATVAARREPPVPVELMARIFNDYERAKARAGRIDFEDMLLATVELLETDSAAASIVRARKRWFSVDEYQDANRSRNACWRCGPATAAMSASWVTRTRPSTASPEPPATTSATLPAATPEPRSSS